MTALWLPQTQALNALETAYQNAAIQPPQPQIIQIPTGCGKSTVIGLLPRYICSPSELMEKEIVIFVVVPNLQLVEQTVRAIEQCYIRHPNPTGITEMVSVKAVHSFEHLVQLIGEREASISVPISYHFWVINIHKLHKRYAHNVHWQQIDAI